MEELTKKEEEVMQIIWKLKKAFVKEMIEEFPDPAPPYNTVSSVVRILEKKGFLGYTAFGKTHQYHPLISKFDYKRFTFRQMLSNYFGGTMENVVSFIAKEENLSEEEAKEIQAIINKNRKKDE